MPDPSDRCTRCRARYGVALRPRTCPLCGGALRASRSRGARVEQLARAGRSVEVQAVAGGAIPAVLKRAANGSGARDLRGVERLRREAELLRAIAHAEHVIDLLAVAEEPDGAPVLVLPRYAATLRDATTAQLRAAGGVEAIAHAVSTALAAMHAASIVHRDLHPGNVLVGAPADRHAEIVVADLGHALVTTDAAPDEPRAVGTAGFIAPEIVAGDAPAPASDVYSLGVLLFWLVTGERPFQHPDPKIELLRGQTETPFPIAAYAPRHAIDAELVTLVELAIARDPAHRPTVDAIAAHARRVSATRRT